MTGLVDRDDQESALPAFTGLRIIELGSWLAAPNCCAMLADLGAEVIKVESEKGDPVRNFPGSMRGGDVRSAAFALLNRGKRSVVIDINSEDGLHQLEALLGTADVFVTNLRHGHLQKLGLAPETLTERFPKLIVASLSGQGLRGPDANLPGFDVGAFWARSGMLSQVTEEGATPIALAGGYGDLFTSVSMFSAIMVALFDREASGKGGLVETSLLQTGAYALAGDVVSHQAYGKAPRPRPRHKTRTPLVNCYRTYDDRWFFLTAVEAGRHFEGVARAIGRDDLLSDPRFASARAIGENAADLIQLLDGAFAERTLAEWSDRFAEQGVWWEKVAKPDELMDDPQIDANGMASLLDWDNAPMRAVVAPFTVFGRRSSHPSRAPELGADSEAVLNQLQPSQ